MADHRNGTFRPPTGAATAVGTAYSIDLESFSIRLKALYTHWNDHKSELWASCDVLAIATPPYSDDLRYLKSSALNIWLLGYEFPETIMVFLKKQIHILCSPKKASLIEVVKRSANEGVGVDVVMHVKTKSDDGTALMDAILGAIRTQAKVDRRDSDSPVVGYIAREAPEGNLLELWVEKLKSAGFQLGDLSSGLSDLFAVKDAGEILNVKKAAYLTCNVMNNIVVQKLENVIDEEKKVTHSSLMDETEKAILEPSKAKAKLKAENVDICYPPIFQSGGKFDLRPSAASNDDLLNYDSASVIICAVGSRYNSYCSNVARTYLIDANSEQSKAYEALLKAHDAVISSLRPGNKLNDAYRAAVAVIEKETPKLRPNLTKSAGTSIGLEFRESGFAINAENDRVIKGKMVFNVSLGFKDLETETSNPKNQKFSLLLADTVLVGDQNPEVLTGKNSKAVQDVAYSFNEEDDEETRPKAKAEANGSESFMSKTTLRSVNQEITKEEHRRQHQTELARRKNEETARRLAGVGNGAGDQRSAAKNSNDLTAYKNVNDLPPPNTFMIQIDQNNDAILLPIFGNMVPFHIATIKNVFDESKQQDTNRNGCIHIIFNVPGTPFRHDSNSSKNQDAIYLKEVRYRSKDPRHISEVVRVINTLRKHVVARESAKAEQATLIRQERLAGDKLKLKKLTGLSIRTISGRGKKLGGSLETYKNGFRYSTKSDKGVDVNVDVIFANVKHAFFQPAEKEMITLVHFHLHNHIMVGNKKTKDVQLYVEVMDVVQTLGGGKRSTNDPDEVEEENRERDRKNKINLEFQNFVNRVNELWQQPKLSGFDLEFDQPLRELGFHGVPYKASAFVIPTSNCLVELVETPFLVVTLREIEIVNLERVGFGQKNFDMAIVFKDFKKDVLRIDSIPTTSLDGIKEWLDTTDIKYYESKLNLNWRQILKTVTDDPQSFIDAGGWEFLNLEASDSDSEHSEESDKGYQPSDVESESESDDDDSDSASLVESEDDDEEEESEEEKGKTWEELEREASSADRDHGAELDSEEERNRRKAKAFGKSRAGPSSSIPKRTKLR